MAMASNLRMGLEVEMQQVYMTFVRTDAGVAANTVFWPDPTPAAVESTMIQHNPILIPMSTNFANIGAVNWDANWGFIVVGDNFNTETVGAQRYSKCIFELGFAANLIGEPAHWTFARRATKVFRRCLLNFRQGLASQPNVRTFFADNKKWYPLTDLIAFYNEQIAVELTKSKLALALNNWQLQLSPSMAALRPAIGAQWTPYICVEDALWTDTQVNYQMDLESLYSKTDTWLNMWKYTWMTRLPMINGIVDPESGHHGDASFGAEIVRNQFHVALWKLAKQQTDVFFATPGLLPVVGAPTATQLVQLKALIMYMFAFGAITPELVSGTYKGSYSQFAKTSPASIANAINWPGMQAHFTSPAASNARDAAFNNMRNLVNIHGLMPAGSALNGSGYQAYNVTTDAIITAAAPAFATMWNSTFNQLANVAAVNNFGYQTVAPFNCYWAFAHTAKPATVYAGNKISILFESRFSHNRLNIGFNPMCLDTAFFLAYESILSISDVADKISVMKWMEIQPQEVVGTGEERTVLKTALAAGQTKGVH